MEEENKVKLNWNFNYEFENKQHSRTKYVIYQIKNTISNKVYIGQTRRMLFERWRDYKKDLLRPIVKNKKSGSNIKLKRSVQKHFKEVGNIDFLHFSIVEIVNVSQLQTEEEKQNLLDQREIFCIREYRKLYGKKKVCNVRDGGKNYKHSEEDKETISKKLKQYFQTPEGIIQREKDGESKKGKTYEQRYGEKVAKEIKEKQSNALKGENHPLYGKKFSEESKEKMSESHMGIQAGENHPNFGKQLSEETKRKIGEKSKGRIHSEETKNKMKEKRKGRIFSIETRQKISESCKKREKHCKIIENIQLQSPDGEIFTKIEGIKNFALEHNLIPNQLCELLSGKRKTHQGWKLIHGL